MPTPSAGQFLHNALNRAGLTSRSDGDRGSSYIAIPVGAHGVIMVTGMTGRAKENELDYRPIEHQGWGAVYYPNTEEDESHCTEFYQSADSDLVRDTALVVKAVLGVIAGRSAS
ncbi:hypothetical protein [Streptomyces botrytidirepellens]|uniref:Uncharacterized protein n=1 Tax=Streptomyces botrytidirepellens TaxID=2486417 RepID=A0A3M8VE78_9ACTN|nr:hypothetical protein [Streptomyces botrytidirepellens]RNG15179.1 hypothetical protein EEJ42_31085 [Streptomyces botrytidirepellens]